MRLIDADKICEGRVSNDPVVIAVMNEQSVNVLQKIDDLYEKIRTEINDELDNQTVEDSKLRRLMAYEDALRDVKKILKEYEV